MAIPVQASDTATLLRARQQLQNAGQAGNGSKEFLPAELFSKPSTSRKENIAFLQRQTHSGRFIVGLNTSTELTKVAEMLNSLGSEVVILHTIGAVAVTVEEPARLAKRLSDDKRIAYIEPDRVRKPSAEPGDAVDPQTGRKYNWAYYHVRAGQALASLGWKTNVPVAIIDTGVDGMQPDLVGRLSKTHDIFGSPDTIDYVGHGTFVAGLISAIDGNGIGTKGIAGQTPLISVRASVDGQFTTEEVVDAIAWATKSGARIINLSLGGASISESEKRAFESAFVGGVLPVAAAGNSGDSGNPTIYPAALIGGRNGGWSTGLSVAATYPSDRAASFSTHNSTVNIAAPGASAIGCSAGVYSTLPIQNNASEWDGPDSCSRTFGNLHSPAGRAAYGEGTSFAAPVVSAVAALVWQANPRLTSDQVADVIKRSAHRGSSKKKDGRHWNPRVGWGVVDAQAAVILAKRYPTNEPGLKLNVKRNQQKLDLSVRGQTLQTSSASSRSQLKTTVFVSNDGKSFQKLYAGDSALDKTVPLARGHSLWVEVGVCDKYFNCSYERQGPFQRR